MRNGMLTAAIGATMLIGALDAQSQAFAPPAPRESEGRAATLTTLPVPRSVATAEAEGRTFPRGGPLDPARAALNYTPGSADRGCPAVPHNPGTRSLRVPVASDMRRIRTGDFTIGGQIGELIAGRAGKISWSPAHDPSFGGNGLLVRAALLGASALPGDTVRFSKLSYGWPIMGPFPTEAQRRGGAAEPTVTKQAFFPTGVVLPKPGTWLVVATSGADWGCLLLDVR
jgi:hypothetical protein